MEHHEMLAAQLAEHHAKSKEWYEGIHDKLDKIHKHSKEHKMGLDNVSDKVNINLGDGGGAGAGGAAMIAALLNGRNQDTTSPAMIAALMNNRANGMPIGDGFGFGGGGGGIMALLLLALLGRRGFDGFGGEGACRDIANGGGVSPAQAAILQSLLSNTADLKAAVPTTALETQAAIQNAIAQLALGTQQGFSNNKDATQAAAAVLGTSISGVKDTVQALGTALASAICGVNQNVSAQGCETREVVLASENRLTRIIEQNKIDDLRERAERAERQADINTNQLQLADLRSKVEVNQTVNTNQQQAQAQFQVQSGLQELRDLIRTVQINVGNQIAEQSQRVVNLGTMIGSASQTGATNVK